MNLPERQTEPPASSRVWNAVTIAALLLQFGLALHFAATASVTHDEYWHLPVGSLHWRTAKFDWEPLNPPLARLWAGLPVAASDQSPIPDAPIPPGEYGDRFIKAQPETFTSLYFRGRCMAIFAALVTTLCIVKWSRDWFGPAAGAIAAITWGLSPNTIAHGSLVTTDMAAALAFVVVLHVLWRFAEQPTWPRAILWGALLGLAQGLKYTNLLLAPLSLALWWVVDRRQLPRPSRSLVAGRVVVALGVSLFVLNTSYLFEQSFRPLAGFTFRSQALQSIQKSAGPLSKFPVPLPAAFLKGIDEQRVVMEQQHPVFLDGEWATTGFATYYLHAIVDKTPIGTLAILVVGLLVGLLLPGERRKVLFLLLPAAALVTIASRENMQLGVRYVLPALALLTIAATSLAVLARGRAFATIFAAVSLTGLMAHPYELAYFNELAGGPDGGREHLLDSNLDWGQDLGTLAAWLKKESVDEVGLAYFGTLDPGALGIHFHLPPANAPAPGLYAVSVNFVMGRPHVVLDGAGGSHPVNINEFGYFRFFRPIARLGHSIDIYRLSEADITRWQRAVMMTR